MPLWVVGKCTYMYIYMYMYMYMHMEIHVLHVHLCRNQGGQLWSLSAESLLDYRDYQQWLLDAPPPSSSSSLPPVTTQEEFQERSGQAWTYLLLQIVKVHIHVYNIILHIYMYMYMVCTYVHVNVLTYQLHVVAYICTWLHICIRTCLYILSLIHQVVRMAERSKALRSGRSLLM